jgi:small subunit ribosomal protein S13e
MGRLHSKGKGISASAIPYSRSVPTWFKSTPETVVDNICKLARKGATPSQIGVVLRDSHGVAQVKVVTGQSKSHAFDHLALGAEIANFGGAGNKILRILKSNGMSASRTIPV